MSFGRDYPEDYTTVPILFTTHDGNGAPVAPLTAFEVADITIYKNGATAKATANGITMTSPLNSKTGLHAVIIDTSNDTGDSGFWTTDGGSTYTVVLDPDTETVNGQTVRKVIGDFSIAVSPVNWNKVGAPTTSVNLSGTTIATTQKVDIETIKTNPVANGGTITFPSNATLASTTNITAGTVTTVSGNVNGNVGGNVAGSIGSLATQAKSDVNAEVDSALADYDAPTHTELTNELATADDAVLAQVALVKSKTDSLTFTVANKLDVNVLYVNGIQVTGAGTSGNPWGPA